MGSDSTAPEVIEACPPRYWWLRRIVSCCAALALLLAVTRAAWGWEAERRLRRMLDEIAAAGDPVRPDDVKQAPVPDAENAATYLIRAAAAVDPDADCPSSSGVAFGGYPPFPPLWVQMADASVAASPKAYELARQARALDRAQWRPPPATSPGPRILASTSGGPLLPVHHLANTVSDAALDMHVHGDDVAALEAIRDTRHLARSVGSYPGIAGCMVARNHESIALYKLQIIATGLDVAPGGDGAAGAEAAAGSALPRPNPPVRPVSPGNVRRMISELLDERYWDADIRPALAFERAVIVEAGEWASRPTRVLRPMVLLDLARALEAYRPPAEAASKRNWPAARAVLAAAGQAPPPPPAVNYYPSVPGPKTRRKPIDFAHLISRSDLVLRAERVIEFDMRKRLERRMAAVSLAAQLYRADRGDWPPDLAALVPKYLPAVPVDPFSADGAPLRYLLARAALPDGSDRPIVYSVNLDGKDDTPDVSQVGSGQQYGWKRARDVHLDLARWPVVGAPATAPATRGSGEAP